MWNVDSGKVVSQFTSQPGTVLESVLVAPLQNSVLVISGSKSGMNNLFAKVFLKNPGGIYFWDLQTGKRKRFFGDSHSEEVVVLRLNPKYLRPLPDL